MKNSHPDNRPAAAPTQPGGAGGGGASPSNTAPSNSIHILRNNIDSLYLSYHGSLHIDTEAKLVALKEMAQSPNQMEQARASLPMGEHLFEVRDKGTGYYPYVLVDNAYRIQISASSAKQIPLAYIQIKSQYLTAKGVGAIKEELKSMLTTLAEIEDTESVSRVDLHVDFTCVIPLDHLMPSQWVTRARRKNKYHMGNVFSGYSFGLGGDITCVLYDKTEEIKESKKYYLHDLWKAEGWNGIDQVYRLEFRFKSRVLREHNITTIDELLVKMGPIWRYATEKWLRLTEPNLEDLTPSRWPTHPIWELLSQIEWLGSYEGVSIPYRVHQAPDDDYLFGGGLSGVTSFMAVRNITDPNEAMQEYLEEAKQYHGEKGKFTGAGFTEYMQEKAATKARKYNLEYDLTTEHRTEILKEIAADTYRKVKDGE